MKILNPFSVQKEQQTLLKVLNAEKLPKNFAEGAALHKDSYKYKKEMPFGISFLFILLKRIELENNWCYNYL